MPDTGAGVLHADGPPVGSVELNTSLCSPANPTHSAVPGTQVRASMPPAMLGLLAGVDQLLGLLGVAELRMLEL